MATKIIPLRPLAVISSANWTGVSVAAIDPGDPVSHDDASSYATYEQPATDDLLRVSLTNKPNDVRSVTAVRPMARDRARDGRGSIKLRVYLGASFVETSAWTNAVGVWTTRNPGAVTRPGGGMWTPADIAQDSLHAAIFVDSWIDPPSASLFEDLTNLWVDLEYEAVPPQIGSARDIPGRRRWFFRRSEPVLRRRLALADGLSFDLLDMVQVSNRLAPHESEPGWLEARTKRRLTQALELTEDPNTHLVEAALRDMRPYLCLFQDTAKALTSAAPWAEGVARFSRRGAVQRTFARDSIAWVPNPASGLITRIEIDQEKLAQGGLLLEGARTNYVAESGFKNGATDVFTGWEEDAAGTGTITEETATIWWDPEVVPRVARLDMDAGGTGGALLKQTHPDTFAADSVVAISIAHHDEGDTLEYAVERQVDGQFYDWSTGAFSASPVQTWLEVPLADGEWARSFIGSVDVGSSATQLRSFIGRANARVATTQTNLVAHVQIEIGVYMTSPILTESVAYTRAADSLKLSNNWDARCWLCEQGALALRAIPAWTPAEIGDANKTLFYLEFDANNYEWGYYDGTNDRLVFERSRGGTLTRAVQALTPTKGQVLDLVFRHTGEEGELDLSPYTASIFVDGVKGIDDVDTGPPEEVATSDLELGSKNGADHWDGQILLIHSYQYVPTDGEAARMPPH